jgi:oxalate decarboxylase
MLTQVLGLPGEHVARIPAAEVYIRQGDTIAHDSAEARAVRVLDRERTHRFAMMAQQPRISAQGGSIHVASAKEYPIATTLTAVVTRLKPGAMHTPHWHAHANEWHYLAKGRTRVTLFAPDKRMATAELAPGDCAYIPRGCGHSVHNIGSNDSEMIGVLDSGAYSESSLSDWIARAPRHALANNLGLPADAFTAVTGNAVIRAAS